MLIVLFLVSHFNFLFVPCGGLSWLPVRFLLHVKYTLSYRIVFNNPSTTLTFHDQYAFRPTGSTAAAVITLLQTVSELLSTNPFVSVYALDFSKAFDTVRHATLLEKMAMLDVPDNVYNWFVDFTWPLSP